MYRRFIRYGTLNEVGETKDLFVVLFNDSIYYNISYGKPNATKEEIINTHLNKYDRPHPHALPFA